MGDGGAADGALAAALGAGQASQRVAARAEGHLDVGVHADAAHQRLLHARQLLPQNLRTTL